MLRLALGRQGVTGGRRSLSSNAWTRTLVAGEDAGFDEVHDVVVVGTGAAGSASALSAKLAGGADCKVVLLEKDKKVHCMTVQAVTIVPVQVNITCVLGRNVLLF
jgi:hypothetical protein